MRKLPVALVGLLRACSVSLLSASVGWAQGLDEDPFRPVIIPSPERQSLIADPNNVKSPTRPATEAKPARATKVLATGTIEPEDTIDVGSQVTGAILSFGVDTQGKSIDWCSPVEAGTVLAQIDPELYAVCVEEKRAACVRAEAELAMVRINLERHEAQAQGGATETASQADIDSAKSNVKAFKASAAVAEALLLQHKAALKRAEIDLRHTTIKSPVKGVVIDRRVTLGQTVVSTKETTSLFLLAKLDKLQIWANVSEADIGYIHEQQPVHFTVDAFPGKTFEGKVVQKRLNATMTQNVVTYTVIVTITSKAKELLPYLTAHLEFD